MIQFKDPGTRLGPLPGRPFRTPRRDQPPRGDGVNRVGAPSPSVPQSTASEAHEKKCVRSTEWKTRRCTSHLNGGAVRMGKRPQSPSLESARMPDALHHSVWLTLPSEPTTPGRHHFLSSMKKGWCEPLVRRSAAQLRRTSDRRVVCGHGARIRTLARLI